MTSNGEPGSEQAQCLEVPQKDARLAGNQRATLPHHAGLGNLLAVLTDKIYMLPDLRAVGDSLQVSTDKVRFGVKHPQL